MNRSSSSRLWRLVLALLAVPCLAFGQAQPATSAAPPAAGASRPGLEVVPPGTHVVCPLGLDYPDAALRARVMGHTVVRLRVSPEGRLSDAYVVRRAGATPEHMLLDDAAVAQAVHCHAEFAPSAPKPASDRTDVMAFAWQIDKTPFVDTAYAADALASLRQGAEAGDAQAAWLLYVHTPYDEAAVAEPIRWLTFAADHGVADARFELGRLRLFGEGVPFDPAGAVTLLNDASAHGLDAATRFLVAQYFDATSPLHARAAGVTLLEHAADDRRAWAELQLGNLHAAGNLVEQDDTAAADLWRRAVKDGDTFDAAMHLVAAYAAGRGVERDLVLAETYALVAAGQPSSGSAVAAFDRGAALAFASGMPLGAADMGKARELAQRWRQGDRTALPD